MLWHAKTVIIAYKNNMVVVYDACFMSTTWNNCEIDVIKMCICLVQNYNNWKE